MGFLIAVEGGDGAGKATQTRLLAHALREHGLPVKQLSFPRYDNPSSALVRAYLGGEFGSDPNAVNAYAASAFYAVDRIASYLDDWKRDYESGGVIVTDRYTVSNAIHQAAKLDSDAKAKYLNWLYDFEYGKLGLPKPDIVFYLDVPAEVSECLRREREQVTGTTADIHENLEFQKKSLANAREVARMSDWKIVRCTEDGRMRSIDDIHAELLGSVLDCLKNQNRGG